MKKRKTKSRWTHPPHRGQATKPLPADHPAVVEGRTKYPKTVRKPGQAGQWALKEGANNSKIGGLILKGPWKGFPVYTLTLEERATCPPSCHLWNACYGNNIHRSDRIKHGLTLEWRLVREVVMLAIRHPAGFVLRLHVTGDFYSTAYVELWRTLLERHRNLHIYGYSARHDKGDPIAVALRTLRRDRPDRFRMRLSFPSQNPKIATIAVWRSNQRRDDPIICPQQQSKFDSKDESRSESCGTCSLCWDSERPIAFLPH
jgi:hypothetical protein